MNKQNNQNEYKQDNHNEEINYQNTQKKHELIRKEKDANKIKKKTKRDPSICVRVPPEKMEELKKESKLTGRTIPEIIRQRTFNKPFSNPNMPHEEAKILNKGVLKAGNNLNQIARRVNSGIFEGWHEKLDQCYDLLLYLQGFASNYGRGKN